MTIIGALFGKFLLTGIGKKLPPWLWEIISIALLVVVLWLGAHVWLVHRDNTVRAEQKAADQKVFDGQMLSLAKKAGDLANKANTLNRQIAANIRSKTDEAIASNDRAAGAIILRGPGKAACPAGARPASATGRPQQTAPQAGASLDPMPDPERVDLIAMPFTGTVNGGREHDDLLTEVKGWHVWYTTFSDQWAKWNQEAAKAQARP